MYSYGLKDIMIFITSGIMRLNHVLFTDKVVQLIGLNAMAILFLYCVCRFTL